tara:strand:- start:316 stop:438 length:123 start_codon:yes stop_codon:yes gene_type:complete
VLVLKALEVPGVLVMHCLGQVLTVVMERFVVVVAVLVDCF